MSIMSPKDKINFLDKVKEGSTSPIKGVINKFRGQGSKKSLLSILAAKGALSQEQMKKIEDEAKKTNLSVEAIIRENRFVDEYTLTEAIGEFTGVPFINLEDKKIPPTVIRTIPQEVAVYYQMLAFDRQGNKLKVAMIDPENFQALEALEFATKRQGLDTEIYITTENLLRQALRIYEKSLKEEVTKALEEVVTPGEERKKVAKAKQERIRKLVEQAPISKIVQVLIKHAVEDQASDIHIEPEAESVRVRYRIDGVLHTIMKLPKKIREGVASRIKVLSNLKLDETRIPQDGRIRILFEGRPFDFRVSTLPTVNGEKVVMRILKSGAKVMSLEELGLTGLRLKHIQQETKKSHGMLLVTGPTGSGKSTTLYSILGILNQEAVNIVTLEDPVEYFIPGIAQAQVNPDVGLTFASGLRSILRQDPDIIMVGEIRDEETAGMAVHAALTGHIVLSTLHTNTAVGAVPRLIDMGIQPFLITASVNIVCAQRLVRLLCQKCVRKVKAKPETKKLILKEWEKLPDFEKKGLDVEVSPKGVTLYEAPGCKYCKGEKYKGRMAIFEAIPVSEDFQDLILSKPSEANINAYVRERGFINMKQDGMIKALQGLTTLEEVFRVIQA